MANSFTKDYLSARKKRVGAAYAAPQTEEKKVKATSNSGASAFTKDYIQSRVNSAPPILSVQDRAKLDIQAANRATARNTTASGASDPASTNAVPAGTNEPVDMDSLRTRLEEAKKAESNARLQYAQKSRDALRNGDKSQVDALIQAMYDAEAARQEIEKEIERAEYYEKYSTTTYDDNFIGQFKANKDVGRLNQDINAAYNEYLQNPTETNRKYADALALLEQQFQTNNQAALDDEGAVLPWITQSAAGYLPQLWDQTKATVGGGAAGALGGAGVGSVIPVVGTGTGAVWGARAGAVAASGVYSYGQMRGAAYRELINAGVDEETARAAANDEAVISALIEMADTGFDMATLGTGKLISLLGKGGVKAATKGAASSASKKLLKGLAGYGLNIAGEAAEEGLQQSVSIANQDRDGTGIWNLAGESASTLWDAASGANDEARDEILEAAGEGAKIAAMFGGATRTATGIANTALDARTGRQMQAMGGDETVQAMIETGLESDKNTESYQLAVQMKAKLDSGNTLSNIEIGRLQQANVKAIEAETSQSASDGLMDLARETVTARENAAQTQADAAVEGSSRSNVPYNVLSMENPVRKARDNAIKNTGYGENGIKAFTAELDRSGESVDQVRAKFQTAYELGRFDTPREKVSLETELQQIAYNAGRLDYIADMGKKANTSTAGAKSGFDTTGAPSFVTSTQARIVDDLAKALGSSVVIGKSKGNAEINSRGAVVIADDFQTKVGGQDVSIVYHAAHEIGMHRLMQLAPTEGRAFLNAMYNYMSEGRPQTAATLIEEKQSAYAEQDVTLTTDKAAEEVVANNILSLYENEEAFGEAVRRIANGNDQQAKRGLEKFREILDDIVKKLRGVIAKLTGKEKAEAKHALGEVEHLREMYENALAAAVKKNRELTAEKNATQESDAEYVTTADGLKYSLKMGFEDQVDAALTYELEKDAAVYVMDTPEMLQALGLKEYPVLMTQKHIRDAVHEKSPTNKRYHGLTADMVKRLPELLENPVMMLRSLTDEDSVVVVTAERDSDNLPVIIAIKPNGVGRYNRVDVVTNFAVSMYGRSNFGSFIDRTIKADGVLYVNKKRTRSLFARSGLKMPQALNKDGFFSDSIAQQEDVVNGETQYSLVTDKKTLEFLDGQKLVKVYRAMQEIDGKLYPPMAAITKGQDGKNQLAPSTKKGAWYQSDERPDLIKLDKKGKPYFELKKGNGKMVPAAYNPYFHTSVTPLNDQFSSAFDRPNLVVVEGYIPESELTSGYKAQYAKDSVGETTWHAGPVASKLKGDKARRVFLSRWFKAERVVPVDEVARTVAKTLEGEGVSVPWNVVTPSLREALEKQGVEIDYKDNKMGSKVVSFESTQEGVQHSLKDSDYLAAVQSGDMETAQRMVDEAAEAEMSKSKIRGGNGKLLSVYHGTNGDFYKFDTSIKGGTNGTAEGFGIYTSDNPKVTEAYGDRQLKLYANITKPAASDRKTISLASLAKLIKDTSEKQAQKMVDDGEYDSVKEALMDTWVSNYVYTYDIGMERAYREVASSILQMNDSDMAVIQEVMAGLGIRDYAEANEFYHASLTPVTGFDGFTTQWESAEGEKSKIILALNSSQLKSADPVTYDDSGNVIPLSQRFNAENEDIRYSLKDSETKSLTDVGVSYDGKTESVNPYQFSLKTWTQSEYVTAREKAAKEMAKALDITEKKALAYIDSVNSIAKMIADDRVRLDYEASPGRSSFVKNAEYGGSIDFSTICKKRRLFTGTFEAIQEALPNTALTAEEILDIRSRMDKKGYEVSCGLCYVEGSRANMGQFTKQFLERYKATNPKYVPNMAEMNTATGQEKIRREHPEVYEAYEYFMNHYGRLDPSDKALFASQQKPKMYQMSTEYQGEILQKFKKGSNVEDKNANGGLRLQSFSDFEIIHLIDTMQVIMDMAHVGLAGQAYTKVPDFAWALGDTGLKINLSLIAKGIDRNGKLILDEKEGMSEANAMALRNRYSENVGTILVVFTDNQLKAAMADDRIDFIIPFHRSQWKTDQYEIMGLPANAKDYTSWQNEAYIEPVYNANGKKQRPDNYMPNTYWDFSKSGKENAQAYLRMCAENNRRPKFHYLLKDNKNGSYSLQPDGSTDGYWKLLIDFKMYDNDGNGVPQRPVRPDFNMEEAQRMLEDYTGGHSKFPAAEDVVAEFVEEYKNSHEGAQFSLKEQNDLLKENAKLKEVNEGLREQFKTTTFAKVDKKSLDKFTKQLLKDYQSGADINEIRDALNDVYTYMANGEDGQSPAWNDLQERAYNVAVSILENASTVNDEMYQAYKSLRDRLRNYPISIDKRYNNDIQGYESINDFRKANFGRLKISNDGTPVDIVYSDLANTYPEFFDETEYTTQADQLTHIADVLDSLQPYEVNPYSSDMRRAATWLASDIIERFYELPQAKPTFADKQAAKLTKQVIKDAKKLENLREKKNERIKDLIQKNREKVKATTQKERQKRVEAVKEIKDHYKAKERKASESRKARELRAKIMRHAQDMSKKLLKPTDKQHIPQKLQGAVAKLLESINLESNYTYDPNSQSYKRNDDGLPSQRTKAFAELRKLYAEMANELVIDPDLLGEDGLLSDVAALADKRIADMTSEELETVYQTMRAVEASVSSANKAFAESRWASIEEAAESIREENKNKRQVTEYAGVVGWGQKLTGLDMMTPNAFFHRLGESGDAIFRMMRNAQDKHIALMKAVEDFTHKELKDVPVKKWEKEIRTVKLGGEDVQLTTAQIMELYVLTKRKQAQDHIFMGGILPETVANKGIKKISRAEPVRGIQLGEVSKVVNLLTAEQKKVADKLQQFASTELSRWGNEAAMQVYNYEKFNESVYWPIRSNRQEIASTVEKDTQVTSVAGRGFSKNTKPNANTSVKIGSIFDTFASHSSEMATYAAWLAPAEDINRIRNYTFLNEEGGRAGTVKGIIERIHGSRGTQYLQKLLSDIANGVGAGRGNETRMDQIVGNYKASAIGANLRVIIQQPTALLRALDMIGPQYIASTKSPLSGWKKAKKYAPIAQWKDWGYFDINTGRQMKDVLFDTDGALDKVKQFTMAGAGLADSISWGMLWNAVENEVKANRKSLKPGTEEFYKAVAARFTEIVDHTQVVDGILQRSQIMRSADGLTKMATSFMGEPTKQYNMVMSALYDLRHTEGRERTIARKRFGRTVTALVVSGVVNAMAQSIIDAVRDDDDEKEYWEKWLTAFFGLEGDEETLGEKAKAVAFGSNLMNIFNPAGYIPYAKDVVSIFQGYDVSRMDMESIEKTISSWNNLWKAINGEGNYTIQGASINFIAEAARLFGVPVANLKREIVSFTTMIAQESDSFLMQYHIEKFFTNPVNSSKGVLDILYNAYATDKDEFDALYKRMLKDDELKTEDKTTAEVIAGKLKGRVIEDLYELYKNDPDAYEEMYDDLIERDFLKTGVQTDDPETDTFKSTAEHIASAMESLMKDEQGVDKVKDLESRYFGPDQQREYDSKLREIQRSGVWKNANVEQRDKLEDNLRRVVLESDEDMMETIEEGAAYGLDDTEYLLYKLALETVDQPNENGKYGTYSNAEKAAAISSLDVGDGETAFLWNTDQAFEAFGYGIGMDKYVTFKTEVSNIKADKDRRGKTIAGSRKKKIIAYLNSLGVSYKEYLYLLGTEYDLSKDKDYRSYFGE